MSVIVETGGIEAGRHTRSNAGARPRLILAAATWERGALILVALVAAILNFWQLDRVGYGNTYYAAAVKSMLQNWHAFFFNSFDSIGFVTIDKPPLGFWLQAASARLFGFSGLSLMLPQALAGVLSVVVLYYLVRRVFGGTAGLLAALALAVMPVSVSASRNNIIDGLLVLTVLLAAWAVTRAVETGRLRWLVLCAVLVGLGFNIKMLEAYLVVPAFGLAYLLGAPLSWRARIGHLVVAMAVLLVISLSWIMAVDLTPASARPYVGSSGTNSALNLALGYNGVGRLTGNVFNRRGGDLRTPRTIAGGENTAPASRATLGGFTRGETGEPGPLRLFNDALGGQVSWLLPLALLGLIVAGLQALTRVGRRFPLDRRGQALVMWGMWLLTQAVFFSVAGFFHTYYMVMLAPSIAALAGIGLVALWHDYWRPGWRGWLIILGLVGTAAVQAYLLSSYPDWSRWLTPLVVGVCVLAAVLLALVRLGIRVRRPVMYGAVTAGALALLAAPTAWAIDTVGGSGGLTPRAGPTPQTRQGGGVGRGPVAGGSRANAFARTFGAGRRGGDERGGADTRLVRYLLANQGTTRYLLATQNAMSAAAYILATGRPVMALGGFSGSDRIVTPDDLARLVANGTVRFFLQPSARAVDPEDLPPQLRAFVRGQGGARGGFGGLGLNGDLTQWVSAHCTAVPAALWQTPSTGAAGAPGFGFGGFFGPGGGQQLYDCVGHPAKRTAPGSTGTAAPSGQGQSSSTGARPAITGRFVAATGGIVTVQSFQGQQSLPTTAATRYYRATPVLTTALAVGQQVAASPERGATATAAGVTIVPPGDLVVYVRPPGAGFGGGGSGSGRFSGGGPRPGRGGGAFRLTRQGPAGTVTALTSSSITIRTLQGATQIMALSATTRVYQVLLAGSGQLQPGLYVAVGAARVGGRAVAVDVVQAPAGALVSLGVPTSRTTG